MNFSTQHGSRTKLKYLKIIWIIWGFKKLKLPLTSISASCMFHQDIQKNPPLPNRNQGFYDPSI